MNGVFIDLLIELRPNVKLNNFLTQLFIFLNGFAKNANLAMRLFISNKRSTNMKSESGKLT